MRTFWSFYKVNLFTPSKNDASKGKPAWFLRLLKFDVRCHRPFRTVQWKHCCFPNKANTLLFFNDPDLILPSLPYKKVKIKFRQPKKVGFFLYNI